MVDTATQAPRENPPDVASRTTALAHGAVAVGFAAVVWAPLLRNYFHLDDFLHLQSIVNASLLQWLMESNGGHLYLLRNAVFALTHAVAGTDPQPYFATVLVTHLVNVALLFALLYRVTGSVHLACLGAAVWGTAPINEGTLGWYAVFGHAMATSFLLVLLLAIVRRLDDGDALTAADVARWYGIVLLASTSFGVGLGVALVLSPAIVLAFGPPRLRWPVPAALVAGPLVIGACYAGVAALYGRLYPGPSEVPFADIMRALVPGAVAGMTAHLAVVGATALVAGYTPALDVYPSFAAYGIAATAGLAGLVTYSEGSERTRRLLVLVGLLMIGCYGMVAFGRAGLFGAFGDQAYGAASPRYHYAGSALMTVALCLALQTIGATLDVSSRVSRSLVAACLVALVGAWAASRWTIEHWDDERVDVTQVVARLRGARDATPPGSPTFVGNELFVSAPLPRRVFAGTASIYTIWFPPDPARPVYAIEPVPLARQAGPPDSRLRRMLVPPACGGVARVACVPPSSFACELAPPWS